MITSLALAAIDAYQRHLSPHKGFTCASLVVSGGLSCSAAVASLISDRGLLAAVPGIMARFAGCARAARHADARVQGVCCCGPIPIPFGWGR